MRDTHPLTERSRLFILTREAAPTCRCGSPSLEEACLHCEQDVCQECAVFVDPHTRLAARPSDLLSQGVRDNFLAHRGCMSQHPSKLFSCVYSKDVPLMLRILKGNRTLGRRV